MLLGKWMAGYTIGEAPLLCTPPWHSVRVWKGSRYKLWALVHLESRSMVVRWFSKGLSMDIEFTEITGLEGTGQGMCGKHLRKHFLPHFRTSPLDHERTGLWVMSQGWPKTQVGLRQLVSTMSNVTPSRQIWESHNYVSGMLFGTSLELRLSTLMWFYLKTHNFLSVLAFHRH